MYVKEVDVEEAQAHLEQGDTVFLDIRDIGSYSRAHIPGAHHIGDYNIEAFIEAADKTKRVVVYCYHGNSSKGGAAHLEHHGFAEVYSMAGGFSAWPQEPIESGMPAEPIEEEQVEPQTVASESNEPKGSRRRRLLNGVLKRLKR